MAPLPWTSKFPDFLHLEKSLQTTTPATLVTGTTIFRVVGGPVTLTSLVSYCITPNDTTASTLQWSADGDVGAATTITAATATLASAIAGTAIVCSFATINTAPAIATAGVALTGVFTTGILVPAGIITTTVGVGSTTGTWLHYLRYMPMTPSANVLVA